MNNIAEFINNNKILTILCLAFILYFIYNQKQINKLRNLEHATNTCTSADMSAIANLNAFAEEIQKGGKLVIPSDVEIQGSLTLNSSGPTINFNKDNTNMFSIYINSDNQFVLQRNDNSANDYLSVYNLSLTVDGNVKAPYIYFSPQQAQNATKTPGAMWFDGDNYQGYINNEFYDFHMEN